MRLSCSENVVDPLRVGCIMNVDKGQEPPLPPKVETKRGRPERGRAMSYHRIETCKCSNCEHMRNLRAYAKTDIAKVRERIKPKRAKSNRRPRDPNVRPETNIYGWSKRPRKYTLLNVGKWMAGQRDADAWSLRAKKAPGIY